MKYDLAKTLDYQQAECIVIGFFEDKALESEIDNFLNKQHGNLSALKKLASDKGDFIWQCNENEKRVLLFHCGKSQEYNAAAMNKFLKSIYQQLKQQKITSVCLALPGLESPSADWQAEKMLLQMDYQHYQLMDFKTQDPKPHVLETVLFYLPAAKKEAIEQAQAIAQGINFARTLATLPANTCTPSYLAEQARRMAKTFDKINTEIHDEKSMKKMGMGSLLAVGQGSDEPSYLLELHYKGASDSKKAPIVLVGKGITFDSGGISLKPPSGMDEMKYDMGGAASVLGALEAAARLNLPVNIIGLVACAENMPGGKSVKPGDIVTSMSGQTIEILNTDAEGRLVLADALTYAKRFDPEFVIDIATLTGAMVIALGSVRTGYMSKDEDLAKLIDEASAESLDKAWRMPLDDDYQEAMNGNLADLTNASAERGAGSITAACFLSRFTKEMRWAHMDIAGTAWVSGKNNIATGRPVALLTEILRKSVHAH